MSSMIRLLSGSLVALMLMPIDALAGGFAIYEHSAKATGRVAAYTATVDDASAVFYNPAALTQIEDAELQIGISLIRPTGSYTGAGLPSTRPAGQESVVQRVDAHFVPVPNIYYARPLSSKAFIGFGIYAPYGLGLTWEDDFVGRTVIEEVDLRTVFFSPSIALKVTDELSIALAVHLVPGSVYLRRTLGATDNGEVLFPSDGRDGFVELSGSAFGVGASGGIHLKLIDHLRLGLVYRSAVSMDFTGNANFELPAGTPTAIRANFPDQAVSAEVTLPHSFALGVGWVDGPLVIEATTNLTLWTSVHELRINFDSGRPQPASIAPRDWTTVPTFRLGGEYSFDDYTLRAGIGYDVNPVPDTTVDPLLPDSNRLLFSFGGGARFGVVKIDLAYMGVLPEERESNDSVNFVPGVYGSALVHIIAATVGFTM